MFFFQFKLNYATTKKQNRKKIENIYRLNVHPKFPHLLRMNLKKENQKNYLPNAPTVSEMLQECPYVIF